MFTCCCVGIEFYLLFLLIFLSSSSLLPSFLVNSTLQFPTWKVSLRLSMNWQSIWMATFKLKNSSYNDFNGQLTDDKQIFIINYILIVSFRFRQSYENIHAEASKDPTKYLSNPINAYLLIKRLTSDWTKVEEIMNQNTGPGIKFLK